MYYFITSRQDMMTSSIEMAQVSRLKIFDDLNTEAKIVTLLDNYYHDDVEAKLGVSGRVINLFQYFQQLDYQTDPSLDQQVAHDLLYQPGFEVRNNIAYRHGKKTLQINFYQDRIYTVGYYDRWGFMDRCDYYDHGALSYREYFDDQGRIVLRQYYDQEKRPVITYYYRGAENNAPVLTLITLNYQGQTLLFDDEGQLRAFFLDELVKKDPDAKFISDRSDYTFAAFNQMKTTPARYQVFHSAFTTNGQTDGDLFEVYQPVKGMLEKGTLTGLIASTEKEARDLKERFETDKVYAIPVTYLDRDLLKKKIPFNDRKKGQLIAVARLAKVKRLDQLVQAVIDLHETYPVLDLKIYGYEDSSDDYAVSKELKQMIHDAHAEDYIHLVGYIDDLSEVYETSDLEVLTSSYEGFAMAVLEAQGHACPVVSYDINYGPSDIIEDGRSGKLLPSGDTKALKEMIANLMEDRSLLKKYSKHAQNAASKYSYSNVKKDWKRFLKNK